MQLMLNIKYCFLLFIVTEFVTEGMDDRMIDIKNRSMDVNGGRGRDKWH